MSPVSYLNAKNAKNDEECTANEDNIANRFEGSDESLHHQLQSWSSANHSEEGLQPYRKYKLELNAIHIKDSVFGQ